MTTLPLFAVGDAALFVGSALAVQAGEVHHSESLFPPPPSTFQGALRSHLLARDRVDVRDRSAVLRAVGPPERLRDGWSIDGPWAAAVARDAHGDESLVPWTRMPLCAAPAERPEEPPTRTVPRRPEGPVTWTLREVATRLPDLLLDHDASPELVTGGSAGPPSWLSADGLWKLLSTGTTDALRQADPPFARSESRVGLALQTDTRTARTGMLYFQRKVRLSGLPGTPRAGLAAWLEVPPGTKLTATDLHSGTIHLGRRAPPLVLEPMPPLCASWSWLTHGAHLRDLPDDRLPDGVEVWLALATPVALHNPNVHGTPARPRLPIHPRCQIEVTAAIYGHPLRIGGLDMATGMRPRPVMPYLQPGASWRLRVTGGSPADRRAALLALHHTCTLGDDGARSFGFGRTWIALPPEDSP